MKSTGIISRRKKAIIAGLAALGLTIGSALPANAAGLATVRIGSSTAVGVSLTWNSNSPVLNHDSRMTVTGRFTNHTATSVKLASFTVCYQSGPQTSIAVSPYTRNASGNFWGGSSGWWNIKKGYCQSWYPNKVYYKQSDGEIVRVVPRVNGSIELIAGFYR